MDWVDKVSEGLKKVAEEAEDMAAIGKRRIQLRTLNGKKAELFRAIAAKVYDLHEDGTQFPAEVTDLCQAADRLANEIKAKEAEIEMIKVERTRHKGAPPGPTRVERVRSAAIPARLDRGAKASSADHDPPTPRPTQRGTSK